jgi:hypothetical protein
MEAFWKIQYRSKWWIGANILAATLFFLGGQIINVGASEGPSASDSISFRFLLTIILGPIGLIDLLWFLFSVYKSITERNWLNVVPVLFAPAFWLLVIQLQKLTHLY